MKKALIFLLLIVATSTVCAQRCYFVKAKNGTKLYKEGRYREARALFVEAKSCPDRPKSGREMDYWIKQCDEKLKQGDNKPTGNTSAQPSNSNKSVGTTQSTASYLSVSNNSLSFSGSETTKTIDVYCDSEWGIGIPSNSWVHLTRNGNKLIINVDDNKSYTGRTDYFVLKSGEKTCRVDIRQERTSQSISVSPASLLFTSTGSTKIIDVYCDEEWEIFIMPTYWVHLTKFSNRIYVRVDDNQQAGDRTDFFVLKSGEKRCRVDIRQEGMTSYLIATPTTLHFKSEGGAQTILITSNSNWKVLVPPANWVQLTRSGEDIIVNVLENKSKDMRSDFFSIATGDKKVRINITQEYDNTHGFFVEEEAFANNFINFQGGTNIKTGEYFLGLSYAFIKSHLGFRLSGYMGLEKSFNPYIVTFDPVFRLTNDNSALDLHFYIGGGVYNDLPIGETGFRFAWKTEHNMSLWDFSLGCMGTLDGDIIPTFGLGVAIPFSPIIGICSWLSKPVGFYDFSKHFFDVTRSVNSNWGISYSYIPKRAGWYVSSLFDNNNWGIVTGPVLRIVPPTNEVDFQLYGGAGFFKNVFTYDFGIRIAPTPNRAFSWWDITLGLTSMDGREYFTIGGSLGITALLGVGLLALEYSL